MRRRTGNAAVNPLHFGSSQRTLFGLYHAPAAAPARPAGVVLCNPLGHEAVRAHRAFRQLANLLAQARYHVMRFDYYGTGDSAGDGDDARLPGWIEDVGSAADELKDTTGVSKVWLLGLRFGATLALLATPGRRDVEGVLAWDPVVSGAAYLRQLSQMHVDYLRGELPEGSVVVPTDHEALGMPLPPALRDDLAAVELGDGSAAPWRTKQVALFSSEASDDLRRLTARLTASGTAFTSQPCPQAAVWSSDRALDAALIPGDVLQAMVGRLSGERGAKDAPRPDP
ncbi:MAG TPA: alpha/beta hydrolase [Polyangia bacterium]|jgi:alpha/beta superfamily hydrolase|nr:alpha/beta hydrolase [Polyangia bacterium]